MRLWCKYKKVHCAIYSDVTHTLHLIMSIRTCLFREQRQQQMRHMVTCTPMLGRPSVYRGATCKVNAYNRSWGGWGKQQALVISSSTVTFKVQWTRCSHIEKRHLTNQSGEVAGEWPIGTSRGLISNLGQKDLFKGTCRWLQIDWPYVQMTSSMRSWRDTQLSSRDHGIPALQRST